MLRWNGRWLSMLRGGNLRKASQIRFSSNQPDPNASSSRITRILHFQPAGSPVGVFDRTLRWFVYAWAGFVGWHTWSHYFYTCDPTYGISMLPTLSSFGDWVIISKWYRRGRGIKVGDLVSFHHPVKEREHAVKRVVGLSGDLVLMNTPGKSDYMIQVPEGHCWVAGDNLSYSRDSRHFGPLPLALISGKIVSKIDWQSGVPKFQVIENGLQPALEEDVD